MTKTKADIITELRIQGVNLNSKEGKEKLEEELRKINKDKNET